MEIVDCLFKALGVGYVLWMLSFLFLQPQAKVETPKAVRPWWLDYRHPATISDASLPVAMHSERGI